MSEMNSEQELDLLRWMLGGKSFLASNLRHDLRNSLSVLPLLAELLGEDLKSLQEETPSRSVKSAVRHLDKLVEALARHSEALERIAGLNEYFAAVSKHLVMPGEFEEEIQRFMAGQLRLVDESVDFHLTVTANHSLRYVPVVAMRGILVPLAMNAIDAVAESQDRLISIGVDFFDGFEGACVVVEDTGVGWNGNLATMLVRFRSREGATTKGPGRGQGLVILFDLVRAFGGSIAITEPAGGGTRAEVRVPFPQGLITHAKELHSQPPAP